MYLLSFCCCPVWCLPVPQYSNDDSIQSVVFSWFTPLEYHLSTIGTLTKVVLKKVACIRNHAPKFSGSPVENQQKRVESFSELFSASTGEISPYVTFKTAGGNLKQLKDCVFELISCFCQQDGKDYIPLTAGSESGGSSVAPDPQSPYNRPQSGDVLEAQLNYDSPSSLGLA